MNLISIQRQLNDCSCPRCNKKNVLQAAMSCSRDQEVCQATCRCSNCDLSLLVDIPEGMQESQGMSQLICSIETGTCASPATFIFKAA